MIFKGVISFITCGFNLHSCCTCTVANRSVGLVGGILTRKFYRCSHDGLFAI